MSQPLDSYFSRLEHLLNLACSNRTREEQAANRCILGIGKIAADIAILDDDAVAVLQKLIKVAKQKPTTVAGLLEVK